jgi:hypothetical protein
MIKLNTPYKSGKQELIFVQKEDGKIHVSYDDGTIDGEMDGNILKAVFHNPKVNVSGLMELTFNETGFEGRWKKGTEPGELKQKWNGTLVHPSSITDSESSYSSNKNGNNEYTDLDGIYEGERNDDGKPHGYGTMRYPKNDKNEREKYIGDWNDGKRTGKGKLTWICGDVYEGEWVDNKRHGKGKHTSADGIVYEGEFEQGNFIKGKITWSDGTYKEGTWENDTFLEGIIVNVNNDNLYFEEKWIKGEAIQVITPDLKDENNRIIIGEIIESKGKSIFNETYPNKYTHLKNGDDIYDFSNPNIKKLFDALLNVCLSFYELYKLKNPFKFKLESKEGYLKNHIENEVISEINAKDEEWQKEENDKLTTHNIIAKNPDPSNLSNLFSQGNFEGVCAHADLTIDYSYKVLDKIIFSAIKSKNKKLFRLCKATIDKFRWDWWMKKGNGEFHTKWNQYFEENKLLLGIHKINLNNNEKYEGEILNSQLHGKGTYVWPNGHIYEGHYNEGKRNGYGVYKWAHGEYYEGDWLNGIRHGSGYYLWIDGRKYNGEFSFGKLHGKGFFSWPDGHQFDGEFKENSIHGFGKMSYPNGDSKEGKWENAEFISGKVFITYDSGNTYDGYFSNNYRNGEGCYTWSDGTKYTGNFLNGERSGKGIYTNPDGKKYTGNFLNGNFHGYGKMTWSNGDYFEGNWENGKRLGKTSFELKEEQKQREEDERRYSEEIARREQEELRHNEEMAKREADELERKKAQEKKKVEEAEEKERKKKQEAEEKTKSRYFEITYKIKLKEDKHQTHVAGGILDFIVMGGMSKTEKTHGKGQLIQRTIRVSHEGQTLSDSSAKNYILQKDADVKSGKAGTSTITIIKIK